MFLKKTLVCMGATESNSFTAADEIIIIDRFISDDRANTPIKSHATCVGKWRAYSLLLTSEM